MTVPGDLRPLVAAPMAGGPSTPELVAAFIRAGGAGFLAGGYRTAEGLRGQIGALRGLIGTGTGGWGVNLFVPDAQNSFVRFTEGELLERRRATSAYRSRLEAESGLTLPDPAAHEADDDGFGEKLELVLEERVPAVTFTFGLPDGEILAALADAGVEPGVTVTDRVEAEAAVHAGARFLIVQGPAAGGHRGTLDPRAAPGTERLTDLLADIGGVGLPMIAAGGITGAGDVARVLAAGAAAAQLGTALLLAEEAGTHPTHRRALMSGEFSSTALTRAFTGRWARGLRNRFVEEHADAPAGYPELHALTSPLRASALAEGRADAAHLWAGEGYRSAESRPAAEIFASLLP